VDWVCSHAWAYCVLDEGHAIRNPGSKVSQAAKLAGLAAQHRLLLSGTPVQNNVGELWSLFDFLMPGLLGSERQFNARYGRTLQVRGQYGGGTGGQYGAMQGWRVASGNSTRGMVRAAGASRICHAPPSSPTPAPACRLALCPQAARSSKRGSAEAEAGLLAVEGLHRQVCGIGCWVLLGCGWVQVWLQLGGRGF